MTSSVAVDCPRHGNKRSHDEMIQSHRQSQSPCVSSSSEHSTNPTITDSSSRPRTSDLPPLSTIRFPGDSFNYRRPAISRHPTYDFIDLTDEPDSPPPHRSRQLPPLRPNGPPPSDSIDVIDITDNDDNGNSSRTRSRRRASTPEVEFISANSREPQVTGPHGSSEFRHFDLLSLHRFSAFSAQSNRQRPYFREVTDAGMQSLIRTFIRGDHTVNPRNEHGFRPANVITALRNIQPTLGLDLALAENTPQVATALPGDLDVSATAFSLGASSPPPKIDPPPSAKPGFTRTPKETDVLICPNCSSELGVGETELKRQVWVTKKCGHVYCGECATNRAKCKQKAVANPKTKAFNKCQATGCTSSNPISTRIMSRSLSSPSLRTRYLILYNAVSAVLWLSVLGRVTLLIPLVGPSNIYGGVGQFAKWTQTLAMAELLHSLFGMIGLFLVVLPV
ncbi:MAG: hypothetical protein M1834_003440 [Cirrosporium novae-zelandiae]|nr:MAG: hypothetical protein M1834_003440 [Cirrosporium novae-zelandiae]